MRKIFNAIIMTTLLLGLGSCTGHRNDDFKWIADRFDDIRVMRYKVPGFDSLPLRQKQLIYCLNQAALYGRDILFDQNNKYNLAVRRTLEGIYTTYDGDRTSEQWKAVETYLKKVWFANGIHHHYSNDKFIPRFSEEYFDSLLAATPDSALPLDFGSREQLVSAIKPVIFDPAVYPTRVNQSDDADVVQLSSVNFYDGVTQQEAEAFYAAMSDSSDPRPVSYGLNSQLVKRDGKIEERTWKVGGMYGEAIEKIVYWLEKAAELADGTQKEIIEALVAFYRSGNLKDFDRYNILWVQDTLSNVDFVNGFIETYSDPLGYKASWEATVNFKDEISTRRTEIISENAQWFEDHSPVDARYKKKKVKGVSAKVINVTMLGGDCYPATPIGINLPNADWIRRDYGSKSVTIQNITDAYDKASEGNGFKEEFVLRTEDRERMKKYGSLGDNLHTDLHECLGHGSGQLAEGVKGDELKQYGSTLEEARADLFGLYYLADPKMKELGLVPSADVAKAEYATYMMNGLMTQLARVELGKNVEEAHMRDRKLIAEWCYEHGRADNVIEKVVRDGKTYIVVNDFDKLRELLGQLLGEVQRIKSEGDFEAGKALVEIYGVKIDRALHEEMLERYAKLDIAPYGGFINPEYELMEKDGRVVDVKITYPDDYVQQMLEYSKNYSVLPTRN